MEAFAFVILALIICLVLCPALPSLQVLLGLYNASLHGGQPDHHSSRHHVLQGGDHHALDHLQRCLRHVLPNGLGAQLPHGHHHRRQLRHHPGSQDHKEKVPEDMVCGGLCLVHPRGLHLSHCGEGNRLGDVQDSAGPAHRALHEDPQFAEAAETLPAHPLHTPMGGGRLLSGYKTD